MPDIATRCPAGVSREPQPPCPFSTPYPCYSPLALLQALSLVPHTLTLPHTLTSSTRRCTLHARAPTPGQCCLLLPLPRLQRPTGQGESVLPLPRWTAAMTMCPPAAGSGQRLHCACRTAATRKQMARAQRLRRASRPSAPRERKQGEGKSAKHRANDPYCCRFSRFLPVWVYARAFLAAKTRLKIA